MEKEEVFPSFRRQNKWLGIIDYKSLVVFAIYFYIIYIICNVFQLSSKTILSIMIVSSVPLITTYFINSKDESIVDILFVVFRFYFSPKKYYYKIRTNEEFEIKFKRRNKYKFDIDKILEKLRI